MNGQGKEREPDARDWIAIFGAILGAFMAVLDIQITNASLKDIQGGIAASLDEGTWISTGYLVAEIIAIPLSAWLADIFSTKRYLIANCLLFLGFSMLCGLSTSLSMMAGRSLPRPAVTTKLTRAVVMGEAFFLNRSSTVR